MSAILTACLIACLFQLGSSEIDYYWRDYTGEIPLDALVGGKDPSGRPIYIGQVMVPNDCIAVVQVFRGRREVYAPCYGVKQRTQNIKVLCTKDPEKFEWISTSNRKFHEDTTDRHLVPGGYDFHNGQLHIGRVLFDGTTKVGSVASYAFENSLLYFPAEGQEKNAQLYQVLVYNEKAKPDNQ